MTIRQDWDDRTVPFLRQMAEVQSLLDTFADPLQDFVDVCEYILAGETVDDCEGEQLDFMGELIGVHRPMLQEDPENIFTYRRLGYTGDPDNSQGWYRESDESGGHFATLEGLASLTDPGAQISDADYRRLIKAKAKTFYKKMTDENLFTFLLTFGARCAINDETEHVVIIEPAELDDLTIWERWYAQTKGFKPAGISVTMQERMTHKDSI